MFLVRTGTDGKIFFKNSALQVNLVWLPQKVGTVKYFKTTEGYVTQLIYFGKCETNFFWGIQ